MPRTSGKRVAAGPWANLREDLRDREWDVAEVADRHMCEVGGFSKATGMSPQEDKRAKNKI